jgi:hypothetical protein
MSAEFALSSARIFPKAVISFLGFLLPRSSFPFPANLFSLLVLLIRFNTVSSYHCLYNLEVLHSLKPSGPLRVKPMREKVRCDRPIVASHYWAV